MHLDRQRGKHQNLCWFLKLSQSGTTILEPDQRVDAVSIKRPPFCKQQSSCRGGSSSNPTTNDMHVASVSVVNMVRVAFFTQIETWINT